MLRIIAARLAQAGFVMLLVCALAFTLFQFVGDPIKQLVAEDASPEVAERLRRELGLDDPVPVQFARYLGKAVRGDFGSSYSYKRPVEDLIAERLPATVELAACAMALAILLGVPLGVYAGINRHGRLARLVMAASLVGVSLPTFLVGILLIYLFSVVLGVLPSSGRGEVVALLGGSWTTGLLTSSGLKSLVLPAFTMALFQAAMIMRLVRSEMLDVMRTNFIRFARVRGLPDRSIHFRHALGNTLMPVITVIGLQLGTVIAFAIITESVFQWPGMGNLFLHAIQMVDIPVMSAYLILIAFVFVVINLAVDLLYVAIDPRLRGEGGTHG
jgi:peptide/nickel transport system permease protein